jgi:manganese/zinc/iron transport system ATP- binding protein
MLEYSTRQISQLSGGQQQRVFLARALLQEADLYLLDEPFAGIDASTEALLIQQLRQLVMEGKTVMVVHHDFNTLQSYFDWVVVLNMRLVTAGPAAACLTRETLRRAYGENPPLLDEAARLSQGKLYGWE